MDHMWKEGPLVDCGVDWDRFPTCTVCGLDRRDDGTAYFCLPFGLLRQPNQLPLTFSESFSKDCGIAQEQLRYFLLGWLRVKLLLDNKRFGHGQPIVRALTDRTASLPNALRAFETLLTGGTEDPEVELRGGRPPFTGPLLEVDL